MEQVSLTDVKPGNILTRYYYVPDSFIVFPKYHSPSEADIERAKHFKFELFSIWADDTPFSTPEEKISVLDTREREEETETKKATGETIPEEARTEQKSTLEGPAEVSHLASKEITIYGNMVALLYREFTLLQKSSKLDIGRILKIASILINYVSNVKEEALLHVSRGRNKYRLEVHSVNTGILSILTCLYLNVKGRDLMNIACGALLHDIGITLLPEGSTGESIREHTLHGFRYLKTLKNIDPVSVMPSLQHHERAHGDGYPNKINLDAMEYSSRMIAICDSFDNQISVVKYGNDISIHFTKDELLTWRKEDYDPQLFMAFVNAVTKVFKKDSIVLLNTGELAMIKKLNIRFPMNPFVQIIADKDGNRLQEEKVIDLIRTSEVWISKFVMKNQ